RQMPCDQIAYAVAAQVLERHPELEGAKPPCLLNAVFRVPRQTAEAAVGFRAKVIRHEAEGLAQQPPVADEDGTAFPRDRQPLVGIERDRVGALQAGVERATSRQRSRYG